MRRDDLLDLNDVLQHPGRKLEIDVSTEFAEEAELDLLRPLEGTLQAVSTGNLLLLTGTFRATAVFECARCGAPVERDLEFDLNEQFPVVGVPSSYSAQDYARVTSDEPEPMFDGNSLMVETLLRQGMILALPLQPLCTGEWSVPCPAGSPAQSGNEPTGREEFRRLAQLLDDEDERP